MPRRAHKNVKRQIPKYRTQKPKDMYRDHGYVPHADNITRTAFDLIKSSSVSIKSHNSDVR